MPSARAAALVECTQVLRQRENQRADKPALETAQLEAAAESNYRQDDIPDAQAASDVVSKRNIHVLYAPRFWQANLIGSPYPVLYSQIPIRKSIIPKTFHSFNFDFLVDDCQGLADCCSGCDGAAQIESGPVWATASLPTFG